MSCEYFQTQNHLSQIINAESEMIFYDFINKCRVIQVKMDLKKMTSRASQEAFGATNGEDSEGVGC